MMLPEHWPLYHKIVKDWRGSIWLVEIGVGEMPLIAFLELFHGRPCPFVSEVYPVSPEYWEKYLDDWRDAGRIITLEAVGGEVVQQDGGGF